MAADAYTGAGIIRIWIDDELPKPTWAEVLSGRDFNAGHHGFDRAVLAGTIGSFLGPKTHLGSIPTAYLEAVAPVRSNKWQDNPLCKLNARNGIRGKKRGME